MILVFIQIQKSQQSPTLKEYTKMRSDDVEKWDLIREKIIGLGEKSLRKSYYPELQKRIAELEKFKTLIDWSIDLLLLVNIPTETIDYYNHAVLINLGYSEADLSKMSFCAIFDQTEVHRLNKIISEFESGTKTNDIISSRLIKKDNSLIPVEVTLNFVTVGQLYYIVALARDVTQRIDVENKIIKLNAELEEKVKEKTAKLEDYTKELESFSYSVSHDLRSPLRTINGYAQIIMETDEFDDTTKDYLNKIIAASKHMAQIIEDLLSLSQITREEIQVKSVNLSNIVTEIAAELQQKNPERKGRFIIAQNIIVDVDARYFRIAMENILGNAWKFTKNKEEAIIEFGETMTDSSRVFYIKDNGAGFDMKYAENLFKPFYRAHSRSEFEGTGVGLAIVQRTIKKHGGDIWAESAPDKGTSFYFTIE
ncbi:MAG TPA: hypothetical protein DCS13_03410 [Candidatus Margulisbacteria bacterium]|nr:hypothetical protein [Candidatus Margulisiibacteriota bacterium]